MDPTTPLRIATRIHFALLRHYGENVAVRSLLRGGAEAREALWVCEGSGDAELTALARQFRAASRQSLQAHAAPAGSAPQALGWSQDTSGFGLATPAALDAAPARGRSRSRWLDPRRWLGNTPPR